MNAMDPTARWPAARQAEVFRRHHGRRWHAPFRFCGSLAELRGMLQTAVELEHATIPPYCCALYSIKDGHNTEAARILRSVIMEEMLHMVLAANVLNAIGGRPELTHSQFVPSYPTYLPHSADLFVVPLEKFAPHSIETFLAIERPAPPGAPPEGHDYHSIGQFYDAIRHGIEVACECCPEELFRPEDVYRQVPGEAFYGGGGRLFPVDGQEAADRAIAEIVEQGEGLDHTIFDPDHRALPDEPLEVAHYFRFNEIKEGRRYDLSRDTTRSGPTGAPFPVDWTAVHDMRPNPRTGNYPAGSELWELSTDFNRTYMALLGLLNRSFTGEPERLMEAVGLMYDLKYKAVALMRTPSGEGETTAGPSFEYVDPDA